MYHDFATYQFVTDGISGRDILILTKMCLV